MVILQEQHGGLGVAERALIEAGRRFPAGAAPGPVPWRRMLGSPAVLAQFATMFCYDCAPRRRCHARPPIRAAAAGGATPRCDWLRPATVRTGSAWTFFTFLPQYLHQQLG
jgi:hypothetical protein